jgi:hypothetical protein
MTEKIDLYDGMRWTETDIEDLIAAIRHGDTIEEVARFLCRSGTVEDVRRKAEELGLKYRSRTQQAAEETTQSLDRRKPTTGAARLDRSSASP